MAHDCEFHYIETKLRYGKPSLLNNARMSKART